MEPILALGGSSQKAENVFIICANIYYFWNVTNSPPITHSKKLARTYINQPVPYTDSELFNNVSGSASVMPRDKAALA